MELSPIMYFDIEDDLDVLAQHFNNAEVTANPEKFLRIHQAEDEQEFVKAMMYIKGLKNPHRDDTGEVYVYSADHTDKICAILHDNLGNHLGSYIVDLLLDDD